MNRRTRREMSWYEQHYAAFWRATVRGGAQCAPIWLMIRFAQDMYARWTPANRVQTRRPRARPDSLADLVTYLCIARRARPAVSVSGDCLLFDGEVDHGVAVVAPP